MALLPGKWPKGITAALCGFLLLGAGCASSSRPSAVRKEGPLTHYQLARAHFEQGKTPEALAEIERALKLDDSLPQIHFYKGYIFWNLEKWPEAIAAFQTALQRNPYYTDARLYLAVCLHSAGRTAEALEQLDLAAADKTYPTPEKVHLNRALILRGQGQKEAALGALRRAVGQNPRFYQGHFEMAQLLEDLRRLGEALAAYEVAAPGYQDDAEFHFLFGRALFQAAREGEARRELRRAVELAPGSEIADQAGKLLGVID